MVRHDDRPVAVLGGGLAGITAASSLRQRGVRVRLFEAGRRLAGLATSFKDAEGFSNDFGAHFVTNRLAAAIGLGPACRNVVHYGEAVWLQGRTYSYPFGLMRNSRLFASALAARMRPQRAPSNVAEYFRSTYGRRLAEEIAIPLVQAWSGAPADSLAPSVATEKFQHGVLRSLELLAASRMTRRAVANGYSHEMPENPFVWHVYPMGGVSALVERLAADLGDAIELESPVEAILVDGDRVGAIRAAGREHSVSAVISTAPCNVLPRLVKGSDALSHLARFRFRPMVFVNLRLRGRGLLPDTVLWTPEPSFGFFRATETTISMPWLAPPGKSIVTVDYGCEVTDPIWTMPDDQLIAVSLERLSVIVPDAKARLLGAQILRTPIAYPVFLNEYEADRRRLRASTGVAGLYSVGRNGEFAHILMEDVYWRTLARTREVIRERAA